MLSEQWHTPGPSLCTASSNLSVNVVAVEVETRRVTADVVRDVRVGHMPRQSQLGPEPGEQHGGEGELGLERLGHADKRKV